MHTLEAVAIDYMEDNHILGLTGAVAGKRPAVRDNFAIAKRHR